jgi:hypothetical protein
LAFHLLVAIVAIQFRPVAARQPAAQVAQPGPAILLVSPPERAPERPSGGSTAANARHAPADDLGIHLDEAASEVRFASFAFKVHKITGRAALLFPFLTRTLSIGRVVVSRDAINSIPVVFRSPGSGRGGGRGAPLALDDAQVQALVDRSWSRHDRWLGFFVVKEVADTANPNAGQLPEVLHQYVIQNGLQSYVDATVRDPSHRTARGFAVNHSVRDLRLWTQLGIAADHTDFIDYIGSYTTAHPSTRATTELLFLLEKVARANYQGLTTLLDTDLAEEMQWTYAANRSAYRALVTIQEHHRSELRRRGLDSRAALSAYYDDIRLAILRGIVETTPGGYRASDAWFLFGSIYWQWGDVAGATRAWSHLAVDPGDAYATASLEILAATRAAHGAVPASDIDRILERERGCWATFSFDRLRKFGYRFDTY